MKKVIVNGRKRYIKAWSHGYSTDGGYVTFFNGQEGLYNKKTGEVIDQVNGKYIKKVLRINIEDPIAKLRLEDDSVIVYEYERKLILGVGSDIDVEWYSILMNNPEAFQYLPSRCFYKGEHISRNGGHYKGYIEHAIEGVEREKSNRSLEELKIRVEEVKGIIEKKLDEEKENIIQGETDRKAKEEKEKLIEETKKQLVSSDDESE